MANTKISNLPAATTPVAGTEVLPIVQSSTTVKVSIANLTAGRAVSALSYDATGSTAPANGMYLDASSNLSFSTNSTKIAYFTPPTTAGGSFELGINTYAGNRYLRVSNADTGTSSYARVMAESDKAVGQIAAFSSGLSTVLAAKSVFYGAQVSGQTASGTAIADFSTGTNQIQFYTGTSASPTLVGTVSSTGNWDVGQASYAGNTFLRVNNASNGTTSFARLMAQSDKAVANVAAISSAYTTTAAFAGKALFYGDNVSGQTASGTAIADFSTGTNRIQFYVGTSASPTLAATVSSLGNLGLGVAPSTTTYKTFEIATAGSGLFSNGTSSIVLTQNAYYDTTIKYANSSYGAGYYQINGGAHTWATAVAGTAGDTIAFGTAKMTLSTAGDLTLTNNPVLSGGTANGVAYLDGSKVLTTGSALTFNGSTLTSTYLKSLSSVNGLVDMVYTGTTAGSALGKVRFYGSGSGVTGEVDIVASLESGSITSTNLAFYTTLSGSTLERMRLDSSGNLGLGVTPSGKSKFEVYTSGASINGVQVQYNSSNVPIVLACDNTNGDGYIGCNTVQSSGSTQNYAVSTYATKLRMEGGAFKFYNAPSGTAGNAITFTQAMTLDASGRLGIGNTSPAYPLDVYASGASLAQFYRSASGSGVILGADNGGGIIAPVTIDAIQFYDKTLGTLRAKIDSSGNFMIGAGTAGAPLSFADTNALKIQFNANAANYYGISKLAGSGSLGDGEFRLTAGNVAGGSFTFSSGGSERARIDSSGNLLVGQTSTAASQSGHTVVLNGTATALNTSHASGTGSGAAYHSFYYNAGAIGSITQNGTTGVLYNLTSDYRLKNNPEALTGAKDFVMALQPKKWQWWDGSGEGVGFIAHEFMEVAKYSGQGEKDAMDEDGKPVYQSIQPSSSEVMANLVAHIQELETRLAALEAK